MKLYTALARAVLQRTRNPERADPVIEVLMRSAPSGSGIDSGTKLDLDKSTADKLVFQADFHHMSEYGFYSGWTEHTVTVRPSLAWGMHLTISGKDRNQIKEYLSDTYHYWLNTELEVKHIFEITNQLTNQLTNQPTN